MSHIYIHNLIPTHIGPGLIAGHGTITHYHISPSYSPKAMCQALLTFSQAAFLLSSQIQFTIWAQNLPSVLVLLSQHLHLLFNIHSAIHLLCT